MKTAVGSRFSAAEEGASRRANGTMAGDTPLPSSGLVTRQSWPPASREGAPSQRRVTVALHHREPPVAAVGMARIFARALGVPLHGLFAWTTPIAPSDVPRLTNLPEGTFEGLVVDVEVGDPAERVHRAAQAGNDHFLVVSIDPECASDELGIGGSLFRTLTEASSAVLLVPPKHPTPRALRRILLPLDGSPSTASAIGPAGDLARGAGASLDILLVGEAGALTPEPERGSMPPPQYIDQAHHEWAAFSNEFLGRFLGAIGHCPDDVEARMFLGAGEPAQEILKFAGSLETDLIVLVWRGHLEEHHGSVFRRVVREAKCPVLVLRAANPTQPAG